MKITTNLREIAISLNGIIEHGALHEEGIVSFQHALDAVVVGRHEHRGLFALRREMEELLLSRCLAAKRKKLDSTHLHKPPHLLINSDF